MGLLLLSLYQITSVTLSVGADVCRSQGNLATPVITAVVSADETAIENKWVVLDDVSTRNKDTVISTNKC
jgi:hypothetical protein